MFTGTANQQGFTPARNESRQKHRLGVIADDFTGASDTGATLEARGWRTLVLFGLPEPDVDLSGDWDALVIGLRTRSLTREEAVAESLRALDVLQRVGNCEQIYEKHCATFDSTPEGNIGPVIDALSEALNVPGCVVVQSSPEGRRTVYQSTLFANGKLVHEGPMGAHPLTPLADSNLIRLLEPQTNIRVDAITLDTVWHGETEVRSALHALREQGASHTVIDALTRNDLNVIQAATGEDRFRSGGSGLLASLPSRSQGATDRIPTVGGRRLVLAGSASPVTKQQVEYASERLASVSISSANLRSKYGDELSRTVAQVQQIWEADESAPVLVYVDANSADGPVGGDAELIELALADCGRGLLRAGLGTFIVAGGETSGSVMRGLNIGQMRVGAPFLPTLSWAYAKTRHGNELNVLLKPGSVGPVSLFCDAWNELQ